jgi:transcriptional regulator with XRE-family HTH domain
MGIFEIAKRLFLRYACAREEEVMETDYIGRRLKRYRELRGLKASELAKLSGVPQSTISDLEHGRRHGENLTVRNAERLAWTLGISLDLLCRRDRDEEKIEEEHKPAGMALVRA